MDVYLSTSPLIRTCSNGGTDKAYVTITRATHGNMQGNTIMQGDTVFSGEIYCPDGHDEIDFQPILKDALDGQLVNKTALPLFDSSLFVFQNGDVTYNTYFEISDGSTSDSYSVLYSTRNMNYEESSIGISDMFLANRYLETDHIYAGQYFDLTYQYASNAGYNSQADDFVMEYYYHTANATAIAYYTLSNTLMRQSFKCCGRLDPDAITGHNVHMISFGFKDGKDVYHRITPKWKVRKCMPNNLAILYYVDSMGGVSWLYDENGTFIENKTTERSYYQQYANISERRKFGKKSYNTQSSSNYVFHTQLVSDGFSEDYADVLNSDYMWLYLPEKMPYLRSVLITDSQLKVKTRPTDKMYNYTYNLEDSQFITL